MNMRGLIKTALFAGVMLAAPVAAQAGVLEGAAIGAGTGAVIAGPPGAVVGGAIGAVVGGPNIVRPGRHYRTCWINRRGHRVCGWR
jgi:hypothetical protein